MRLQRSRKPRGPGEGAVLGAADGRTPWLWKPFFSRGRGPQKIIQPVESSHLADGETQAQVSRMAWLKLPPKLLLLWVGGMIRFAFDSRSSCPFPQNLVLRCPHHPECDRGGSQSPGQGEVFLSGLWGSPSLQLNAPSPWSAPPCSHSRTLAPPSGHTEHCSWSRSAWRPSPWNVGPQSPLTSLQNGPTPCSSFPNRGLEL